MIVYTVKSLNAYKQMREEGYLEGNLKYIWPEFKEPYHWMMEQMQERISG